MEKPLTKYICLKNGSSLNNKKQLPTKPIRNALRDTTHSRTVIPN